VVDEQSSIAEAEPLVIESGDKLVTIGLAELLTAHEPSVDELIDNALKGALAKAPRRGRSFGQPLSGEPRSDPAALRHCGPRMP